LNLGFLLPPILTMMHLRIMLYTYWTALNERDPITDTNTDVVNSNAFT